MGVDFKAGRQLIYRAYIENNENFFKELNKKNFFKDNRYFINKKTFTPLVQTLTQDVKEMDNIFEYLHAKTEKDARYKHKKLDRLENFFDKIVNKKFLTQKQKDEKRKAQRLPDANVVPPKAEEKKEEDILADGKFLDLALANLNKLKEVVEPDANVIPPKAEEKKEDKPADDKQNPANLVNPPDNPPPAEPDANVVLPKADEKKEDKPADDKQDPKPPVVINRIPDEAVPLVIANPPENPIPVPPKPPEMPAPKPAVPAPAVNVPANLIPAPVPANPAPANPPVNHDKSPQECAKELGMTFDEYLAFLDDHPADENMLVEEDLENILKEFGPILGQGEEAALKKVAEDSLRTAQADEERRKKIRAEEDKGDKELQEVLKLSGNEAPKEKVEIKENKPLSTCRKIFNCIFAPCIVIGNFFKWLFGKKGA